MTVAMPSHLSLPAVAEVVTQTLRTEAWTVVHQSPQEVLAMRAYPDFHALAMFRVAGDHLEILSHAYFKEEQGKIFVPGVPKEALRHLRGELSKALALADSSAGSRRSRRPASGTPADTQPPPSLGSAEIPSFAWLTFATPPQTRDELAVAQLLDARMVAYNHKDITGIMQHIAPEARIHSRQVGDVVSREQFHQALAATLSSLERVSLQQVTLETLSPVHMRVRATLVTESRGKRYPNRIHSDYLRRQGEWLIIRTLFVE
jgi:hypothetical protein